MDRSGGVVADVPSTSGAGAGSLGAGSGSLGGEREIRAKVENCKVKINTWETDFAKAHGRKPTGDEVRADKQVYAMYREYRVLKADLEKENAAQTRGGAKPSAPESRVPTTSAPPLRDVGSNAPRPSARRPAADSSDDEDDDEKGRDPLPPHAVATRTSGGSGRCPIATGCSRDAAVNIGNRKARGQAPAPRRVQAGGRDGIFGSLARTRGLRDAQIGTGDGRLRPHGGPAQSRG